MDWVMRLRPFLSKAVRAAPGVVGAIAPELAPAAEAVKNLAVSLGAGHRDQYGCNGPQLRARARGSAAKHSI